MKVLQINSFGNLSTGRIACDISQVLKDNGHQSIVAYSRGKISGDVPNIHIGSKWSVYMDGVMTRITDRAGFYSKKPTQKLIKQIEQYNPDIIHLHNLHGYYLNIELLFQYLKRSGKPVVWTLHDCWSFTGHCCYYDSVGCKKWQIGCHNCEQKRSYPKSLIMDRSKQNYEDKKNIFLSISNLNLVCVSQWLKGEISKSFLQDVPSRVIYNGIDTNVFCPTLGNFRNRYKLNNKKIILGVASTWSKRKGLSDFFELSKRLDERYKVVLIGLSSHERKNLPDNILGIGRTDEPKELAEIYTNADVFFNASVEETFGLTTIESLACGTPVVIYNSTALPEIIRPDDGYVVEPHDLGQVINFIQNICEKGMRVSTSNFRFSKKRTYQRYIDLYKKLL